MNTRIRELRLYNKLTQAYVAIHLGISVTGYSRYEKSGTKIPLKAINKLAKFYGVSVDSLLEKGQQ